MIIFIVTVEKLDHKIGTALIAKVKYIGMNDVPYYEFRLCKYDERPDEVWDTERDYCGSIPFDRVVS